MATLFIALLLAANSVSLPTLYQDSRWTSVSKSSSGFLRNSSVISNPFVNPVQSAVWDTGQNQEEFSNNQKVFTKILKSGDSTTAITISANNAPTRSSNANSEDNPPTTKPRVAGATQTLKNLKTLDRDHDEDIKKWVLHQDTSSDHVSSSNLSNDIDINLEKRGPVSKSKSKHSHSRGLPDEEMLLSNEKTNKESGSQPQVIERKFVLDDFDEALRETPTSEEQRKIQQFDPSNLNYTALRQRINNEVQAINKPRGRYFGFESFRLPNILRKLSEVLDMDQVIQEIESSVMTTVSCNACKGGVGLLQHYVEQGSSKEDIVRAASKLCTNFAIETPRVCFGIIHLLKDEVLYVMDNLVMDPDGICGFLIGDVCGIPQDPYHKWKVLFPPYPKPPLALTNPPKENVPTLKVLHLSDTHFDPYYLEGSNAECNEPMCCRQTSGKPASRAAMAGKWGDYRKCDTPERTIRSMFQNIAHAHPDIDYIIWTGDLPPHDIWNQTRDTNLKVLLQTVQQLFDYFPNTPVFPALGNHESAPVNSFPPPSIPDQLGVQWLYSALDEQWRRWLPEHTSLTILKGGYYSVQVLPGFRIISLNMNYCNNKNWWLLLDSEDPADQLQWLVYELQASELRNEKVHIIGHIPPGYRDCLRVWSQNFYTIINRYESTVSAQFYGHTHYDEFEIFYDLTNNTYRPTSVAYVAPSITTYYALNPGYRLYYVEAGRGAQQRVVDHETWVMDLDKANLAANAQRDPRWYPLYSAREAYDMPSLSPLQWDHLVYRMEEQESLFDKFYRHYWKNSPERDACDAECRQRILCDLRSGRSSGRQQTCSAVQQRVRRQERRHWREWLLSGVTVTTLATLFLVL